MKYKIISLAKKDHLIDKLILEAWCEINCIMPYFIEDDNHEIIIKLEDDSDMVLFCMSPEYSIYKSKVLVDT